MNTCRGLFKRLSMTEKLIWFFTLTFFCSFTIFEQYSWGRYVLLGVTFIIAIFSVFNGKNRYNYVISSFHYHCFAFIAFTLMSATWGMNFNDSIVKGVTLIEILFCLFFVNNYFYYRDDGAYQLLSIVKWASYIISIYSLLFYGIEYILEMVENGARIGNEYTNINTIGMLAAIGITIQIDQIFANRRFMLSALFCAPSFYMLIATQSRKAFVMLIGGVVLSAIIRNVDSKNGLKTALRIVLIALGSYLLIRQVLKLPIFGAILNRIDKLIAAITGEGDIDHSAMLRRSMVEIGMRQFKKTPILGIGIGCSHLIVKPVLGLDTYLHNNFVELLACGGIVGTGIYYSFYLDIFYKFSKFRAIKDEALGTCLILAVLLFAMDWGRVSLYSKSTYFYFMLFFVEIGILKRRASSSSGRLS